MAKPAAPALFGDDELHDAPEPIVTKAVEIFNAVAKRVNEAAKTQIWCEARALTAKRRKRLKTAIADYGGLRGFQGCLEDAARNAFLLGKEGRTGSHRNWRPDLDFFLQEKTVTRLLEGGYAPDAEDSKRIHMPTVWRPPTADAKPFVQTETLEQRLAASIVSYRKIGNYKRANEIEERLAALEKRPPVMVPAPEVARVGFPDSPKPLPMRDSQKATGATRDSNPHVTDVSDEYDSIPESEQFEDA